MRWDSALGDGRVRRPTARSFVSVFLCSLPCQDVVFATTYVRSSVGRCLLDWAVVSLTGSSSPVARHFVLSEVLKTFGFGYFRTDLVLLFSPCRRILQYPQPRSFSALLYRQAPTCMMLCWRRVQVLMVFFLPRFRYKFRRPRTSANWLRLSESSSSPRSLRRHSSNSSLCSSSS